MSRKKEGMAIERIRENGWNMVERIVKEKERKRRNKQRRKFLEEVEGEE